MSNGGNARPRPLSPHLQIYKWQITAILSILHRMTGLALVLGVLLLVWWLVAAAGSPSSFADVRAVIGSWFGRLVLFGFSFALFYHLCNGIRHMFWDIGKGYELTTLRASGLVVVAISLALTLIAWVWGYAATGAF